MPSPAPPIERLDLRFRVSETRGKSILPGGLVLWTLVGVTLGIGVWIGARQLLRHQLSGKLAKSDTAADAFLALEGLQQLDGEDGSTIVLGLLNDDANVRRAVFLALDERLVRWQAEDSEDAQLRMITLAESLQRLSAETPGEGHFYASALASEIAAYCVAKDSVGLAATVACCEQVIRAAASGGSIPAEDQAEQRLALTDEPPPPLPPVVTAEGAASPGDDLQRDRIPTQIANGAVNARLAELGSPASSGSPTSAGLDGPGDISLPSMTPLDGLGNSRAAFPQAADGNPQSGIATLQVVPYGTRPRERSVDTIETSFSLNDETEPLESGPVVVQSAGDQPLMRMRVQPLVELSGLQEKNVAELVKLLGSVQPKVSQAASLALRARGWPDEQLALASDLATCSEARRLKLLHEIAANPQVNPRPWLLWMAEDAEPAVRRTAVSLLSSMVDPSVERALRQLLGRENDSAVVQTIQQVLMASANSN